MQTQAAFGREWLCLVLKMCAHLHGDIAVVAIVCLGPRELRVVHGDLWAVSGECGELVSMWRFGAGQKANVRCSKGICIPGGYIPVARLLVLSYQAIEWV